jgi:hypothetical protein
MPLEVIEGTRPCHVEDGYTNRDCLSSLGASWHGEQKAGQQERQKGNGSQGKCEQQEGGMDQEQSQDGG